jgi:hypothetical protein
MHHLVAERLLNASQRAAVSRATDENAGVDQKPPPADRQLRPVPGAQPPPRVAFIAGAEERSRRELGRGLSEEELERVLRRYPGDLPKRK